VINLPETKELAAIAQRGLNISCTLQDGQIMLGHDDGSLDIVPVILKSASSY
jgi:uncharacterized protein YaeQ